MGFNTDNFDKEFSLNQNRKKTSARGKLTSWLMILAGVAVIGGVVAARQPVLRQTDAGTRTTVSMPAGQMVAGEHLVYNAVNDEQVSSSELEARFLSQGDQALSNNTEPADVIEPTPTAAAENMLVLAPEKPAPAETTSDTTEQTVSADTVSGTAEQSVSAGTGNDKTERPVSADAVSDKTGQSVSAGTVSDKTEHPVSADAVSDKTEEAAPEIPEKASAPAADNPADENTAVAWLDDKAYAVSVKPADEMPAAVQEHQTDSVSVPVKVLDAAGNEKKQPQTTVFELDGKEYAIQLTELSPEEAPAQTSAEPVVWIDKTPLQVSLSGEGAGAEGTSADPKVQMDIHLEITLNPLPAEQTAALQQERFGMDLNSPVPADEDPFPTATEEPAPVETEEPQEENWFASFFNNLFGAAPTEVPTPQVTVIALTPTPTVPQPTATPLVIRMEATAEAQGPVRLDAEGGTAEPVKTAETTDSLSSDPAVKPEETGTETESKTTDNGSADVKPSGSEQTAETQSTKAAPAKLDAVVVDSFDKDPNGQQPTSEPKELPHTGGLEGWNIPSLLIMLAGLLLVIIGVRRLRTKE